MLLLHKGNVMDKNTQIKIGIGLLGCMLLYVAFAPSPSKPEETSEELSERYAEEAEESAASARSMSAEAEVVRNREEGRKALDAWDQAIRTNNETMLADLQKHAVQHKVVNTAGFKIDSFVLKDGRVIQCTTTAGGNGPAITNCDGEP
jgi:hypothetical protein